MLIFGIVLCRRNRNNTRAEHYLEGKVGNHVSDYTSLLLLSRKDFCSEW
jgi:hypothetical protein